MSKFKLLFLFKVIAFLNSCATTEKYQRNLQYWIGREEEELVTKWGVPTSVYPLDSKKLLLYRQNFGTSGYATPMYGSAYVQTQPVWCETTFIIVDKKITDFNIKGNSCVAD